MKFRTRYDLGEPMKGLQCNLPSRTQQQFKQECEIDEILKRHNLGIYGMQSASVKEPLFIDCSDLPDYQSSQNNICRATEYFNGLPSGIRSQFNNNLAEFLACFDGKGNREKLEALGILGKSSSESSPVFESQSSSVTGAGQVSVSQSPSEAVQTASVKADEVGQTS